MLRRFSITSYQEIADVCEVPVGTVRSRLNQARGKPAQVLLLRPGLSISGRKGYRALQMQSPMIDNEPEEERPIHSVVRLSTPLTLRTSWHSCACWPVAGVPGFAQVTSMVTVSFSGILRGVTQW